MVKRGIKMAVFLMIVLVLVIMPLISAGFFDEAYAKITGKLTSNSTSLNITVGNSAPTITVVDAIINQEPVESGFNTTVFNFTATDIDGFANIDSTTAEARFQLVGEATRTNTSCINVTTGSGNNLEFTCAVDMFYFDKNDLNWIINATVRDLNGASGENTSRLFQFNLLTSMVLYPDNLTWPEIGVADTNTGSDADPIVLNNTGNDENLTINVTGHDLQGAEFTTEFIFATNISVDNVTEGCSGTSMVNDSSINVTSATLDRGNNTVNAGDETSGQQGLHFCVTAINSDLSPQAYSSAVLGSWLIQIIT